ncbi:MAG: hypothetical protein ACYC6N_06590 [Pirellulaceae bacterium]
MPTHFSTAGMGQLLGAEPWRIRRLFEAGVLPEPGRIGRNRAIPREMIPQIVDALRDREWLPEPVCTDQGGPSC